MANAGGLPCPYRFGLILMRSNACRRQAIEGRSTGATLPALAAISTATRIRSGADRRRDAADRSRLGGEVQRARPGRPGRPQSAGAAIPARQRASSGSHGDHRERADAGDPRRRALANCRSLPVAVRRVPRLGRQANLEPGTASLGYRKLPPVRAIMRKPTAQSKILKKFPGACAEIAKDKGVDPPI